ncbi:chitinase-like protein 1 [Pyrus x bretschneideri]|uniref:chitinase-like protein 1 n=1 Tax=Pyrus x bretschneideri TaxID=225117 RepID=UPI00202FF863|nr:chitinase-like protein 1 [Pyrus x bretschneideri]
MVFYWSRLCLRRCGVGQLVWQEYDLDRILFPPFEAVKGVRILCVDPYSIPIFSFAYSAKWQEGSTETSHHLPINSSSTVHFPSTCTPFNHRHSHLPPTTPVERLPHQKLAINSRLPRAEANPFVLPHPTMKISASALVAVVALSVVLCASSDGDYSSTVAKVKIVRGKKLCDKGWECKGWSKYCCNLTISDYFQTYQFENLFSKRNTPVAHAVGFWDYQAFITAAALFEPLGFGTTGGKLMQMKEIAAFLGHVGSKTSCGYGVATGGPFAWGLCYNREMSPMQSYCDDYYKYTYPCSPGAEYYGRGALPIYWNYNYGAAGDALKVDLLNHPEYIEQNATLAFQAAVWRWMTPIKKSQPSAHEAFVGDWKPTKNDTLSKRFPGFGTTMNILYGESVCGKGDIDAMNNIVSHYQYYLDLMGVGRDEAGPHDVLTCAEQVAFNPIQPAVTASS